MTEIKITLHEMFGELEKEEIEQRYFSICAGMNRKQNISHRRTKVLLKQKIRNDRQKEPISKLFYGKMVRSMTGAVIMCICCIMVSVLAFAVPDMLEKSEVLEQGNRYFIGKEITDTEGGFIWENGVCMDRNGNKVEFPETDHGSRSDVIQEFEMGDSLYRPSSVVEVPVQEDGLMKEGIPELIMTNNSVCLVTKENGEGWDLKSGARIKISFEKYSSEVVEDQVLMIGYVRNGIMYEGEIFREMNGTCELTVQGNGICYPYLVSFSSDYLSLKKSELEMIPGE